MLSIWTGLKNCRLVKSSESQLPFHREEPMLFRVVELKTKRPEDLDETAHSEPLVIIE